MLTEIKLTAEQVDLFSQAARHAGAHLLTAYEGKFDPAGHPSLGLRCSSPGNLMRFAGLITLALGLPGSLLGELAVRVCEDGAGYGAIRVYYWPGVHAPQAETLGDEERAFFDSLHGENLTEGL
jgi:hypothetical protein